MSANRRGNQSVTTVRMSKGDLLVRSVMALMAMLLVVTFLGVIGTLGTPTMIAGWIVVVAVMLVLIVTLI